MNITPEIRGIVGAKNIRVIDGLECFSVEGIRNLNLAVQTGIIPGDAKAASALEAAIERDFPKTSTSRN